MSQPSVLWMVSDHQVSPSQNHLLHKLPLQSRMAKQGVRFSRAYTVLPICSPARASMLTGSYPHAHGLTENDGRFGGRDGLGRDEWLVNQPLFDAGYRCGWFGKWHLNNHYSAQDFGFEGFSLPGYGYPYNTHEYAVYLERRKLPVPEAVIELPGESGLPESTRINLTKARDWFDFEAGAANLLGSPYTHESHFLVDSAISWIDSLEPDTPFFMRIDPWGPHPPYIVSPFIVEQLGRLDLQLPVNFDSDLNARPIHHKSYRDYWHQALNLDRQQWQKLYLYALAHAIQVETALCRLLDHLEQTGRVDSTLVIFNADHGDAVASNGGVSNKGGLMVEQTLRIPLFISGPSIIQNYSCNQLVANVDLPATVMDFCHVNKPDVQHGRSLKPLLLGSDDWTRKGLLTQHYGLHELLIQRSYHQDNWKLVLQSDGFTELYDLETDPGELNNLALQPDYSEQLKHMSQGMLNAMDDVGDNNPMLDGLRTALTNPARLVKPDRLS